MLDTGADVRLGAVPRALDLVDPLASATLNYLVGVRGYALFLHCQSRSWYARLFSAGECGAAQCGP
jgi:hypothetical protein